MLGALLGVACWWLYGLEFSMQYDGRGIDLALWHWLQIGAGAFFFLGLLLGSKAADVLGEVISAIFPFRVAIKPG
ncbi:hypothetical protein SAMN02745857_03163 [Andreprevotia lacus DSM 23236]|jgi:hypothetical protein|uniref:Uncharacterized protein n=1 Tax=Andreprevotia lacus DSM 23236 TaxID=1121001 RepID=A0A1W1XW76_9NEIS|nr:hypothetical protein [Andreprevotia lacus]SMC28219.1 hypothetical protein SAMN02745857_03163 [Andreprevotia lacus DSM 23236]